MPWTAIGPDGTFGNRFDDPRAIYRVLYSSFERCGCFLETLARFRMDLELLAQLKELSGPDDFVGGGVVPRSWLRGRLIGRGEMSGRYGEVYAAEWLGAIREAFAPLAVSLGASDIDAAFLQQGMPRTLTQPISRMAFESGFDGLHYRSRFGHEIRNWAIFEPSLLAPKDTDLIAADDPDLLYAFSVHRLRWEGTAE